MIIIAFTKMAWYKKKKTDLWPLYLECVQLSYLFSLFHLIDLFIKACSINESEVTYVLLPIMTDN